MRNVISEKNKYYISKHRYLELRHFCLQYYEWERDVNSAIFIQERPFRDVLRHSSDLPDKTSDLAIRNAQKSLYMRLVKDTCFETDKDIGKWLFIGVSKGESFDRLKMLYSLPCEKDMYYDRYRKFFWLLDKKR